MTMFVTCILFTGLLLAAAWAGGCAIYDRQTKNLIREARHLSRYNIIMGRTTPERAERGKTNGNKVYS